MRYTAILIICLLTSCQEKGHDLLIPAGERQFQATPPSRLYFKNIRGLQYTTSNLPGSRAELFYPKKMVRNTGLLPVIADHWLEEEAYFFLLPYPPHFREDRVQIAWEFEGDNGQIRIEGLDPRAQRQAGMDIATKLSQGYRFFLIRAGDEPEPIWQDDGDRRDFQIAWTDYLRLTESD